MVDNHGVDGGKEINVQNAKLTRTLTLHFDRREKHSSEYS